MSDRILHLIKDFSPPSQTFIYDLINSLENSSSDSLHIVGFYRKRVLAGERNCREVVSVSKRRDILGRLMRFLYFKGNAQQEVSGNLHKLINKLNPQLIHAHFAWTVWDLLIPYSQYYPLETPVLVSIHGTDLLKTAKQSDKKRTSLINFSETFRTHFTVANNFMFEELVKIGIPDTKIRKVAYSISDNFKLKEDKQAIEKTTQNCEIYRIACIGRLVKWKGQRYLIEAVSHLIKKEQVNCMLTLIGDGSERKDLEALVKNLQIEDSVQFSGFIDHLKIPQILFLQNVYVQPSIYDEATGQCEAFGISILEAISCGLPVIASRSGGIPEVVGEGSEFSTLVKPADSDELYSALLNFYHSNISRKNNLIYAKKRLSLFSKQKQMDKIKLAYASLLSK